MRVVVGDIVVNPSEIRVRLLRRVCCLQVLQSTPDHTVPEQTWKQSDLQREPVLGLSDVEDVATVRRASCGESVWTARFDACSRWWHTLAFLILLHVFLCKTELLAFRDVQVDLMADVCDDGRALSIIRMS